MANEPEVPARTVRLLRAIGIEPVPVHELCCGGPVFNAGMGDLFAENADGFIEDLREKGIRRLVLSCPGCLNIIKNNFDPGFFAEHFIKDMGIALDEAKRMGLSLPGLALAHQLYLALQAQGCGRNGTHALQLALASLSNIDWKGRNS